MTENYKREQIIAKLNEIADRVDESYLALTGKQRVEVETALDTLSKCFDRRRQENHKHSFLERRRV